MTVENGKIKLTVLQKLRLRIGGRVFLRMKKKPGWKVSRPTYVLRCPRHGLVESVTHGWEEDLYCPECVKK